MACVLVTGGAGYIGSHTVQKLLMAGHRVVVVDNLSTGFRDAVPLGADFFDGDVRDSLFLSDVLKRFSVDIVVHFAAKLNVAESLKKPIEYYENNVGGVVSLLKACQAAHVKKVIFSSTAAVYGDSYSAGAIPESAPKAPLNPYGRSKLVSEQIIQDYSEALGLNYLIFRYFNVAGASLDGRNGQRTAEAYHLVHLASLAGVGRREGLKIFGTDYPTPDGTCIRDYIHIEDLADVHVAGVEYLMAGGSSATLNCGYGRGYSVREVIETALACSYVKFKVEEAARRDGDPASLVANSDAMRRLLGWSPKFNSIEIICRTAIDWERRRVGPT